MSTTTTTTISSTADYVEIYMDIFLNFSSCVILQFYAQH